MEISLAELLMRNEPLRNCHKGKRCFVIANGSSVSRQDLSPMKDEISYVMNFFLEHPLVGKWQPNYYCFADPNNFDGTEAYFYLSNRKVTVKQFYDELNSRVISSMFIVPAFAANIVQENSFLPFERTCFVQFQGFLRDGLPGIPDFTKAVPGIQSVSQMAIMAAMYMGCSPIYLMGFDHDWLVTRGVHRHFYGTTPAISNNPAIAEHLNSYRLELESQLILWYGYEHIYRVAEENGIQILNATDGGFLDVFPRVDYNTLFNLESGNAPNGAVAAIQIQTHESSVTQPVVTLPNQPGYWGDLSTWEEAKAITDGYESDAILLKVKDALLKVKSGEAAYERDSVIFDRIQYPWLWNLLEGLLKVAGINNYRLSVLDFGGSLGSTYYAVRDFLSWGKVEELKWNIVEQKNFVDCGKEYFEDGDLHFYNDIETCKANEDPNVIILSSVLQYIETPFEMLQTVMDNDFQFIIFDRTSFIPGNRNRLTVQKVPPAIYPASYPAWFFGIDEFLDIFKDRYVLSMEFDGLERCDVPGSFFKGFMFSKIPTRSGKESLNFGFVQE